MVDISNLGLGRRHHPDDRDLEHLMRNRLGLPGPNDPAPQPRTTPWRVQACRNQLQTSTCVGHGWRHKIDAEPIIVPQNVGLQPEFIYKGALPLDAWPENDNEVNLPFDQLQSGTSVRAAAQFLQSKNYIGEYTWAFDISTVQQVVSTLTPVVLGTSWSESMFNPTAEGIVTYDGKAVGGHCYLCIWFDLSRGIFLFQNSWGSEGWGIVNPYQPEVGAGFFWMPGESLEKLIHEDGEACTSTELLIPDASTGGTTTTVVTPPPSQTVVTPPGAVQSPV